MEFLSLYDLLVHLSKSHAKILNEDKKRAVCFTDGLVFNLDKKTISSRNFTLFKDGEVMVDVIRTTLGEKFEHIKSLPLINVTDVDFYEQSYMLYNSFKNSVPSAYDMTVKSVFHAKSVDDLSFHQMLTCEKRSVARVKLEAYIMLYQYVKSIEIKDGFYYKPYRNSDFIIFNCWIKNKKEEV